MLVIKRYPNRKLYDTEAKQYITLEGVANLIRQGREVQVVDNITGEDLTTLTLTLIIFEQEKKQSGFVPRSVLTGLVQAGGYTLPDEQLIGRIVAERSVPTRDDLQVLIQQIEALTAKIEEITGSTSESGE